jgi:3-oxoacyl-(acyl-carrier-protein) synthase
MDRSARLSTLVMSAALDNANAASNREVERDRMAAVSGTAFGNVDGSMRFMKRMLEKGAQFASPVDFPNMVPAVCVGRLWQRRISRQPPRAR